MNRYYPLYFHDEEIQCPECNHIQVTRVFHTMPFWDYTKVCEKCKHFITESDWKTVKPPLPKSNPDLPGYATDLPH